MDTPLARALSDATRYGGHVIGECRLLGGRIDLDACPSGVQAIIAGCDVPEGARIAVELVDDEGQRGAPDRHRVQARLSDGAVLDVGEAPPHVRLVATVGVRVPAGAGIIVRALVPADSAPPRPARRVRARDGEE